MSARIFIAILAVLLIPRIASAQDVPTSALPPEFPSESIFNGGLSFEEKGFSIGPKDAGGFTYNRSYFQNVISGSGWHDTITGELSFSTVSESGGNCCVANVTLFGQTESFGKLAGMPAAIAEAFAGGAALAAPVSVSGSKGGVLTFPTNFQTIVYTAKDGTVATFDGRINWFGAAVYGNTYSGLPSPVLSISKPTGENLSYNYTFGNYCNYVNYISNTNWQCIGSTPVYRLNSVINNFGYEISYSYLANVTPNNNPSSWSGYDQSPTDYYQSSMNWFQISSVSGINVSQTTPPTLCTYAAVCAQVWPTIKFTRVYNASNKTTLDKVVEPDGHTINYSYSGSAFTVDAALTSIEYDSDNSTYMSFLYGNQSAIPSWSNYYPTNSDPSGSGEMYTPIENGVTPITGITTISGTTSVSYAQSDSAATGWIPSNIVVTFVDPLGKTRTLIGDQMFAQLIGYTDEDGRNTSYQYDASFSNVIKTTFPSGKYVTKVFDIRSNVLTITTNPAPGIASSQSNLVQSYVYGEGPSVSICANSVTCNLPSSMTDPNGHVTNFTYSPIFGGLLTKTDPADVSGVHPQERYTYSQFTAGGQTGAIWLKTGSSSCVAQDPANLVACIGTSGEQDTYISYANNLNLMPTSETIASGDGNLSATTKMAYDVTGNLIAKTDPVGNVTNYTYDAVAREKMEILPVTGSGPRIVHRNVYDAHGLAVETDLGTSVKGDGSDLIISNSNYYTFDTLHREIQKLTESASGAVSVVIQSSYDADSRLQCSAVRMNVGSPPTVGSSACLQGTGAGQNQVPYDRITQNVYDAAGQMVQVLHGVGTPLQQAYGTYAYSPDGKQTDLIDANGNHAQLVYDGFDRQIQWTFPSKTPASAYSFSTQAAALTTANAPDPADYEAYTYDANGNRLTLRKRDATVLTYTYDALNRVVTKAVPQRTGLPSTDARSVYYTYDLLGHQLRAWFDSSTSAQGVSNAYDALGRIVSTSLAMDSNPVRTISYCYDVNGNRTLVAFPDSIVATCPAPPGTATTAPPGWTNYAQYTYDGLDRPIAITTSGGTTPGYYSYNSDGTRASFSSNSSVIKTNYTYDPIDRLSGLTNTPVNSSYSDQFGLTYDAASEVTQLTKSNSIFVFTGAYSVSRPYIVNGLNQYASVAGVGFSYDQNGNLTGDGTNTYLYDIENRLVTAGAALNATLRYDPLGRLYEVVGPSGTTHFIYGGNELLAEYDVSGNLLRRYVHGGDLKFDDPIAWYEGAAFSSASERLLRPNWQGSIELVTDSSGNSVYGANTYDEYGIPGANNVGRFQYTGQTWIAELGMNYYKARMYSPTLGRFMQTDPIGYNDQVNLYDYAQNDPVDRADPTGRDSIISIRSDGSVHITLPVTFSGDGATPQNIRDISRSIENTFTGNFDGTQTTTTVVSGKVDGLTNTMIITNGPADGGDNQGHSYVRGGNAAHVTMIDQRGGGIDGAAGKTTSDKGKNTAAHEGGHLLGLPDTGQPGPGIMGTGNGGAVTGEDVKTMEQQRTPSGAINDVATCSPGVTHVGC